MTLIYIHSHRIDDGMCMRRNNIQGLTKLKINFSIQISNIVYPSEMVFFVVVVVDFFWGWVCFCSCMDELATRLGGKFA